MNRTYNKGSITVEAIVMLGFIATMTPILYKHVAERRQDIENINEANTLLLLKNAVSEYISVNKNTLTTGTIPLANLGLDNISGYQIGIKKDSSGNIDAMITGTGGAGNDLRAAKVAALLGVSAGIYSAQNTAKAWGINGVWAEDISNYGFTSLPTGIPVITTSYDKEENISSPFDINDVVDALKKEDLEIKKLTVSEELKVKKLCLINDNSSDKCIEKWQGVGTCKANTDCNLPSEVCYAGACTSCITDNQCSPQYNKCISGKCLNCTTVINNTYTAATSIQNICPGSYIMTTAGGGGSGFYNGGITYALVTIPSPIKLDIFFIAGGGGGAGIKANGSPFMISGGGGGVASCSCWCPGSGCSTSGGGIGGGGGACGGSVPYGGGGGGCNGNAGGNGKSFANGGNGGSGTTCWSKWSGNGGGGYGGGGGGGVGCGGGKSCYCNYWYGGGGGGSLIKAVNGLSIAKINNSYGNSGGNSLAAYVSVQRQ